MSGAGNDFILFDNKINPKLVFSKEKIAQFCNRRTGIGADGILIIHDSKGFDFGMQYFNSDGSTGSLCGNSARCSLHYAKISGLIKNSSNIKFEFNNQEFSGEVFDNGQVKFNLHNPKNIKLNFGIKVLRQLINASYADTGSPHVVIRIEDVLKNNEDLKSFYKELDDFPVLEFGKLVRFHDDFTPAGTNVNFVQVNEGKILIRTYERGVEEETLSCGTGSVASAVLMFYNNLVKKPVEILARSGDQLIVDFDFDGQNFSNVSLTGPAKVVFNGEITT